MSAHATRANVSVSAPRLEDDLYPVETTGTRAASMQVYRKTGWARCKVNLTAKARNRLLARAVKCKALALHRRARSVCAVCIGLLAQTHQAGEAKEA